MRFWFHLNVQTWRYFSIDPERWEEHKIMHTWILSETYFGLIFNPFVRTHTHWRLLIRKSKVNMQKWLEHWFHWSTFSTSQKSDTKHMHTFISHPCVMSHLWCDNKCTIWNHPIAEKIVSKYLVISKNISRIVRFNGFTASKCFEMLRK